MNILSKMMIDNTADEDKRITTYKNKNTNLWHVGLMINHRTPSGCDRWMLICESKCHYKTKKSAITDFKNTLKTYQIEIK